MEKKNRFQKKNLRILIMTFTIMIFSVFFISNKVSAKELTDFCDYTEPCLTTEQVESWLADINESTGREYDSYIFSIVVKDTTRYYSFIIYNYSNYENGKISFSLDSDNFYKFHNQPYTVKHFYSGSGLSSMKISLNNLSFINSSSSYDFVIAYNNNSNVEVNAYYSNRDIIDKDGNLILKANINNQIEEDEIVVNNRTFLEKFINFNKQLFTIIGNIVSTIIKTPLLMIPFGFCILLVIISIFYKLFLRR